MNGTTFFKAILWAVLRSMFQHIFLRDYLNVHLHCFTIVHAHHRENNPVLLLVTYLPFFHLGQLRKKYIETIMRILD